MLEGFGNSLVWYLSVMCTRYSLWTEYLFKIPVSDTNLAFIALHAPRSSDCGLHCISRFDGGERCMVQGLEHFNM